MIQIRIHGRGGQGSVAAAYLLASAAFEAGFTCQAFPSFGAERRGAPVTAFVRIDNVPIHLRAQIQTPDYLIVQDDTLLQDQSITAGLRQGGAMLVNSDRYSDEIAPVFKCRAFCVPATQLAMETIGRPIPNTALLAAFVGLTGLMPLSALATALERRFTGEILARNQDLIKRAAASVPQAEWKDPSNA